MIIFPPVFNVQHRLKADKELVKEVYSAARRFKMERVKQVWSYQ